MLAWAKYLLFNLPLDPLDRSNVEDIVSSQSVWEFLSSGGVIMIPIALCSVAFLTLAMERLLALRREKVLPQRVEEILAVLAGSRPEKAEEALSLCQELDAPASRILAAGIRRRERSLQEIERGMEDQAAKEMEKLRGNIRHLSLIAGIAPLLGLLGTVIGIQDSFALVVKAGLGNPEHLAGGIEVALVTTIAGLTVAIPALLMASYLNSRVRQLMIETDDKFSPVLEGLCHAS